MNKLFFFGLLYLLPIGYFAGSGKKYVITNYNITFSPDLSNRVNPGIYPRPLNDIELLKIITADLYPTILNSKRSQYQKDKLLVDFVNKGLITRYNVRTDKMMIDFGRFKSQLNRIDYIMNRRTAQPTFTEDKNGMNAEFARVYGLAVKDNVGADIWTYLDQGINETNVLIDEPPVTEETLTYVNHYRNVLVLPTDGYIEAGIFGKGFDLGQVTVNSFRRAFLASGEQDMGHFFKNHPEFRIKPVHNPRLRNLEILVLELYDRSLTKSGSATVHPTDMEIMQLYWSDWLKASGVKNFALKPCANSKAEAEKIILDFLNVSKIN